MTFGGWWPHRLKKDVGPIYFQSGGGPHLHNNTLTHYLLLEEMRSNAQRITSIIIEHTNIQKKYYLFVGAPLEGWGLMTWLNQFLWYSLMSPFLSFSLPLFHGCQRAFFFWSDGGPPAGGGPRHVPIVPRP